MMAACRAAQCGAQVLLLEKNEKTGKKIFITGKGRCNLTNACDIEELFTNVTRNAKFLYSAFYGFSNTMTLDFFEKNGCRLKIERGNRVFPVSDHSSDVIKAMEGALRRAGAQICLHTEVKDIICQEGRATGVVLKNGKRKEADAVIIATGGLAYPSTGSTGDGYRMAAGVGNKFLAGARAGVAGG